MQKHKVFKSDLLTIIGVIILTIIYDKREMATPQISMMHYIFNLVLI